MPFGRRDDTRRAVGTDVVTSPESGLAQPNMTRSLGG